MQMWCDCVKEETVEGECKLFILFYLLDILCVRELLENEIASCHNSVMKITS